MSNSVEVVSTGQVLVQEVAQQVIEVTAPAAPAIVEVVTAGPQGVFSGATLADLDDVNVGAKVNKSVLYYDAASGDWLGDDINTLVTVTDGGNW